MQSFYQEMRTCIPFIYMFKLEALSFVVYFVVDTFWEQALPREY